HSWQKTLDPKGITVAIVAASRPTVSVVQDATAPTPTFTVSRTNLTIKSATAPTGAAVVTAWAGFKGAQSPQGWDIQVAGDGSATLKFQDSTGQYRPGRQRGRCRFSGFTSDDEHRTVSEGKVGSCFRYSDST